MGVFHSAALFGGFALYIAGHLLVKRLMHGALSVPRLVTLVALLVSLPAASFLPPLAGLAGVVTILGALVLVETRRYSAVRNSLRGA